MSHLKSPIFNGVPVNCNSTPLLLDLPTLAKNEVYPDVFDTDRGIIKSRVVLLYKVKSISETALEKFQFKASFNFLATLWFQEVISERWITQYVRTRCQITPVNYMKYWFCKDQYRYQFVPH